MKAKKGKCLWQIILAVFVTLIVMITEFMPVTVRAEASAIEKNYAAVYDYDYYKSHNADLQKAFGNERQSYIDHFVKHGMKEGRQGSEEFNLDIYKSNYADLSAAFKTNNAAYYMHYIQYGKAEGRNAKTKVQQKPSTVYNGIDYAAVYNYEYYRTNNTDLQKIFGEDSAKYLDHFVKYGMKEGRQGSEEFSLEVYKSNYADLSAAFKTNNAAYYMHYIQYGKPEGRNAKTKEQQKPSTVYNGTDYAAVYNYEYYRTNNTDLQKIFGEDSAKYLEHFVKYGMKEGRQGSEEFNLDIYKSNYADLSAAFRTDNAAYYMHYIKYGKPEGRNAKTLIQDETGKVAVIFDANGGYFGDEKTTTRIQWWTSGSFLRNLKWEFPLNNNERMGFSGWYLEPECINEVDFEWYFVEGNVTFYAKWITWCAVTYDANGGYFWNDECTAYEKQCAIGELIRLYGKPEASNHDEHLKFTGWYLEPECINEVNFDKCVAEKDITFYAKWEECYSIKMDANGGYFENNKEITIKNGKCLKGDTLESIGFWDPQNADEHQAFLGWYLEPEYVNKVDRNYIPESDIILYAKWEKSYIVTYDPNGGYYWENGVYKVKQAVDSLIIFLVAPYPPDGNENIKFAGWYFEPECINKVQNNYIVESDITLYAKWETIDTQSFDLGESSADEVAEESTQKQILETQVMMEEESIPEAEVSVEVSEGNFETLEEVPVSETFETSEVAEETIQASEEETTEVPETVEETSEEFVE